MKRLRHKDGQEILSLLKILKIFLICFSLTTTFPFSNIYAQTNSSTTSHQNYNDTKDVDSLQGTNYINLLTMIAAAFLTTRMFIDCKPPTTDMYVGAAGGVALVIGEIMNMASSINKIQALEQEYQNKMTEQQKAALETQKASYEEAIKNLETKLILQYAAVAAYSGAAVLALMSKQKEEISFNQCLITARTWAAIPANSASSALCYATIAQLQSSKIEEEQSTGTMPSTQAKVMSEKVNLNIEAVKKACPGPQVISACSPTVPQRQQGTTTCQFDQKSSSVPEVLFNNRQKNGLDMWSYPALKNLNLNQKQQVAIEQELSKTFNRFVINHQVAKIYLQAGFRTLPTHRPIAALTDQDKLLTLQDYIQYRENVLFQSGALHSMTTTEFDQLNTMVTWNKDHQYDFVATSDFLKGAINAGIDLIIPQAQAFDIMKSLNLIGPAAAAFAAVKIKSAGEIDKWITNPKGRAVMWGILGALTFAGIMSTNKLKSIAQDRIEKIEEIIAGYTKDQALRTDDHRNNNSYKNPSMDNNISLNNSDCIRDESGQCVSIRSSVEQTPAQTTGSAPVTPNTPSSFLTPDSAFASDAAGFYNSAQEDLGSGNLSEGTIDAAANLANQAADLSKLKNALLQEQGLDSEVKRAGNQLLDDLAQATTKALSTTPSQGLMASTPGMSGLLASGKLPHHTEVYENTTQFAHSNPQKEAQATLNEQSRSSDPFSGLFKKKVEDSDDINPLRHEDELKDLDITMDDINSSKGSSLFNLITNRYIKSFFPTVFEKVSIESTTSSKNNDEVLSFPKIKEVQSNDTQSHNKTVPRKKDQTPSLNDFEKLLGQENNALPNFNLSKYRKNKNTTK